MNEISAFQLQHPLSPRKFWKKISTRLLVNLIYSVFLEFVVYVIFYMAFVDPITASDPLKELPASFWVGLVLGIYALLYFLITIVYAIYVKVYIKRYYYDCGEQFITIKKGVFAPTEIHVQYQKIQDVYVDQDILDRMFGIYDVHISSATMTSGIEAHIDGVSFAVAENIKNIILAKIHNVGNASNVSQIPVSQPQQISSNPVQLNHKISSETYPVSGRWVWSALVSAIIQSLLYTAFLAFIGFSVMNELKMLENMENFISITPWLIGSFSIIFLYRIIWISIWKSNYYFEFLPEFILLKTGVISRQENHLPYKSIQNVLNTQGVIDRLLGISSVVIENAAVQMVPTSRGQSVAVTSGISLVWQTPAKAQELNEIVNNIVSKINPQNSNSMGL